MVLSTLALAASLLTAQPATKSPTPAPPLPPADRVAAWSADIDACLGGITAKHANAFHTTPKDRLESAAADLKKSIPERSDADLAVGIMQLCALVGDAHTMASMGSQKVTFRGLAIDVAWFKDGVRVVALPPEHADLIGGRVTAIGSMPFDAAFAKVRTAISAENDSWAINRGRQMLRIAEILHAVGVTPSADEATFTIQPDSGPAKTITLQALPSGQRPEWKVAVDLTAPSVAPSLKARPLGRIYGHTLDPTDRVLYAWYDACQDQKGQPSVADWARELVRVIDEDKPERVIFDLRRNSGGNSMLLALLVDALAHRPQLGDAGKLFVLIGRQTFSSGMLNAIELKAAAHATLVGLPTGGKPTSYGEVKTFPLPNSGIVVQYSTKLFARGSPTVPALGPDLLVEPAFADLQAGRDITLEAARTAQPAKAR